MIKSTECLRYFHQLSLTGINSAMKIKKINTETDDDTIGSHFLSLLHGEKPSSLYTKVMNVSLILYAEHEFNASTFAARVCASTLSDIHSCITAAIGTLRGPLHGGANEAAMDLIQSFENPDDAENKLMDMLARKEKIMGFGHAVYKVSDPRNNVIKGWSEKLANEINDDKLYPISVRCEEVMWREKSYFAMLIFFMHQHIILWEFQQNFLRQFLLCQEYQAGLLM